MGKMEGNINETCGALHPEVVAKAVAASGGKYDLGVTFDGDADRALFADKNGKVVNGDAVLLLAGREMKLFSVWDPRLTWSSIRCAVDRSSILWRQ